jgi:hypothetical protein
MSQKNHLYHELLHIRSKIVALRGTSQASGCDDLLSAATTATSHEFPRARQVEVSGLADRVGRETRPLPRSQSEAQFARAQDASSRFRNSDSLSAWRNTSVISFSAGSWRYPAAMLKPKFA